MWQRGHMENNTHEPAEPSRERAGRLVGAVLARVAVLLGVTSIIIGLVTGGLTTSAITTSVLVISCGVVVDAMYRRSRST